MNAPKYISSQWNEQPGDRDIVLDGLQWLVDAIKMLKYRNCKVSIIDSGFMSQLKLG